MRKNEKEIIKATLEELYKHCDKCKYQSEDGCTYSLSHDDFCEVDKAYNNLINIID